MYQSRRPAKRRKAQGPKQNIQTLSGNIEDFLKSTTTRSELSAEPLQKRQKLLGDSNSYDSILLKRSTFEGTFPRSGCESLTPERLQRLNAPVTVHIEGVAPVFQVEIYDKDKSKKVLFKILEKQIRSDGAQIEDVIRALQVDSESNTNKNPVGEGCIWTETDITLTREGEFQHVELNFSVKWNVTNSLENIPRHKRPLLQRLIKFYLPRGHDVDDMQLQWSPQEFYKSAHVPDKVDPVADLIHISDLTTKLYSFQKRSLRWMLSREGKAISGHSIDQAYYDRNTRLPPYSFRKIFDKRGNEYFVSDLFDIVTSNVENFKYTTNVLRGGILAEEMGLGKTVEIIALICLHRRQVDGSAFIFDPGSSDFVLKSAATLIITPRALLSQWKSELSKHAPSLRVLHYEGVARLSQEQDMKSSIDLMASVDIVLTSYDIIGKEIHYARPAPDRSMRTSSNHKRPKSLLMQISWWRVCLDEAQMIESGISNSAKVAKEIPRVNAWVISGTPIKRHIADLFGLLVFLRVEPLVSSTRLWHALIEENHLAFSQLFNEISLRHTKQSVRDELCLPRQKRFIITVPFTPVEEQHYRSLFDEMCEDIGVNKDGSPQLPDWEPNTQVLQKMKQWLNRLRRTVLHPEVGLHNRKLGSKQNPMRTVEEVLATMLEQSESSIRLQRRELLIAKLRRGQALENGPRVKEALQIWTSVLEEAREMVVECRDQIRIHRGQIEVKDRTDIRDNTDSSDDESPDLLPGIEREKLILKRGNLKNRLRNALEIEHMATFYQANAYYQIKENPNFTKPGSAEYLELDQKETQGYDRAKTLRQILLKEISRKALQYIQRIVDKQTSQSFIAIPNFLAKTSTAGIDSHDILDRFQDLGQLLDAQALKIIDWREHIISLLQKPLIDDESNAVEITGNEYEDSTTTQAEISIYIQGLQALTEYRQEVLTGEVNALAINEIANAIRFAKNEDHKLFLETLEICNNLKPDPSIGSIRPLLIDLRTLENRLRTTSSTGVGRDTIEHSIIDEYYKKAQKHFNHQKESLTALLQEIGHFNTLLNLRIEFYRALQAVSDQISPLQIQEEEKPRFIEQQVTKETRLSQNIAASLAKHRYLIHLRDEEDDPQQLCVICQFEFEFGVLTRCGHQFCQECIKQWWRMHRSCPICKRVLQLSDIHNITKRTQELKVLEEVITMDRPTLNSSIYSKLDKKSLSEIKNLDLNGLSFTTKVDTLVRHILWLRKTDQGAKSIIFTQYRDFISILSKALKVHGVGFASFDDKERSGGVEKFKQDKGIEVFLLHARAHSSGLNLLNASHVILCEPLVNAAIELQAIARVDRIGQQKETTVWLYIVEGTVEANIHEMSIRRRMGHILDGNESTKGKEKEDSKIQDENIEAANSRELQDAGQVLNLLSKEKTEGEMVQNDDLWACLFGCGDQKSSGGPGGWNGLEDLEEIESPV